MMWNQDLLDSEVYLVGPWVFRLDGFRVVPYTVGIDGGVAYITCLQSTGYDVCLMQFSFSALQVTG